jgi:VWFA-related protein
VLPKFVRLQGVLLLSCIASAFAQQPGNAQQSASVTATLRVTTQLTVENVTVTDPQGRPVHGLTQSDFTIKEDGKPQTIRNFNEYGMEVPTTQPALPPLPPGIYTNQQSAAPTTSAVNVLMLDEVTAPPAGFMYVRLQALSYLKHLPAGTRAAVLMSGDSLRVVQGLTSDREILVAAINAVKYEPVFGTYVQSTSMPSSSPVVPASVSSTPSFLAPSPTSLRGSIEGCVAINRQSQLTLNALASAAAYLFGIQGRKNLIWFTPGIPWLTNYQQFSKSHCIDDYTVELQKIYAMLNAAQVALYPINPMGLTGGDNDSLKALADATGGITYYNRNDLDAALGEVIATGSDYYSLSYTPPLVGYDGKFHAIDVKVDLPGLHLQYRKGYTSLDLVELTQSMTAPANKPAAAGLPPAVRDYRTNMAHGALPSTQLLLAARVLPSTMPPKAAPLPVKGDLNPKLHNKALVRYDIIYSIPAGQFTVAEGPNGTHMASVEFDIVAYGEDGTKLNVLRQPIKVTLNPDRLAQFQQKPFDLPFQLDLPPGKLFLRIGALDVPSGKIGTLEVPQTVVKPSKPS